MGPGEVGGGTGAGSRWWLVYLLSCSVSRSRRETGAAGATESSASRGPWGPLAAATGPETRAEPPARDSWGCRLPPPPGAHVPGCPGAPAALLWHRHLGDALLASMCRWPLWAAPGPDSHEHGWALSRSCHCPPSPVQGPWRGPPSHARACVPLTLHAMGRPGWAAA